MPLLLLATGACSRSDASGQKPEHDTVVASQPTALELPMPLIPDSITTQEGRIDYIVAHFWDPMDWADTVRSHNTDFVEQNFVNYVTFFRVAQQESVEKSVNHLLKTVTSDSRALSLLMETAEKYLYEPDSPMLNEEYFEIFLKAADATGALDQYARERGRFLLGEIAKNRRGSIAADFTFTDTEGRRLTLHSVCKKSPLTLVIFYEPDCETCAATIASLSADTGFNDLVTAGKLSVVMIYPGDDRELWQQKQSMIPPTWHNGIAAGPELSSHELYSFRAMPTLYLLDSTSSVLSKDLPLSSLPSLIEKLQ